MGKILLNNYNCFCGQSLLEILKNYYVCNKCQSFYVMSNSNIDYSSVFDNTHHYHFSCFIKTKKTLINFDSCELITIDRLINIEEIKIIVNIFLNNRSTNIEEIKILINKYLDNLIFL